MQCFPPYTSYYVTLYLKLLKESFLRRLSIIKFRLDGEASRYNQFIEMYSSLALIHNNLQGKLNILSEFRRKTSKMVLDMIDYRTKFIKIDKEIKYIKDWIKLYFQKQQQGKSTGITTDCTGMYGYRGEAAGDGLYVQYFENELFKNEPISSVDYSIDHVWPSIAPNPELSRNNFSVRWYGFLVVPKTGSYTLELDSDCGGVVKINGDIVIKDRIESTDEMVEITDWNKYKNVQLKNAIDNDEFVTVADSDSDWKYSSKSEAIEMFKGQFYDLEVFYTHTVHDSYLGLNTAYVRLKWESMDLPNQAIPGFYYYKHIMEPVDVIFEYDKSIIEIDSLFDNKDAFTDSKEWRVSDIPLNLNGIIWLKSLRYFYFKYIQFKSTVNITIYIAIDWTETYPLENGWQRTDLEMSMLQVNDEVYDDLMNKGRAVASDQVDMAVYRRDFYKGDIKIRFNIADNDYRNLLVFAVPNLLMKNYTCGGSEKFLSDSADAQSMFAGCEASSSISTEYSCAKGLSTGQWKTDNEGIGSFILVKFQDLVFPTHIEIQYDNYADMNKMVKVWYNDARYYDVTLRQSLDVQKIPIKNATYTDYVKLEVMQVYGTNNNGFNLKIYGLKCQDEAIVKMKNEVEMERFEDNKKVILKCSSTLSNTVGIKSKVGETTLVYCEESCKTYIYDRIYGKDKLYSSDSSLCRAAYYEDIIGEDGGYVYIEWGKGQEKFEAGPEKNGVVPEPRPDSDSASVLLAKLATPSEIANSGWKEGEIIDYRHELKCWTRGKIDKMSTNNGKIVLDISAEGVIFKYDLGSDDFIMNVSKCGSKYRGAMEECDTNNNNDEGIAQPVSNASAKYSQPKAEFELHSFEGGDCLANPLDCLFEDYELKDNVVKCENDMRFVKMRGTKFKRLNCKSKCIKKVFDSKEECVETCPGECGMLGSKFECAV